MTKLTKIAIGSVAFWLLLAGVHAWLNLGLEPASLFGKKTGGAEEARFRVGFLPVT
jgi:hypothetical protein